MAISNLRPSSAFEVAWRGVSPDDLAGETAARIAADNALQAQIDAEEAARIADVNAEEARAKAAEAALAASITAGDALARSELLTEPAVSELASMWSATLTGEPNNRANLATSNVVFDGADGLVIQVSAAGQRAPRAAYRMVAGHKYEVLAMARRETNPHDPAGEVVKLRVAWLSANKAQLSLVDLEAFNVLDSTLHLFRKVVSTAAGTEVDIVAPTNTVYFTPFIQTYGTDGVTNIIPYIRVTDLTSNTLISADITALTARVAALESANLDSRLTTVEGLLTGSQIARFKTRGAAAAATIAAAVGMVETLSYAVDGDGGGARYKRIAGPSTSIGDFQSVGPIWWEYVTTTGALRLAEWGVADGLATKNPTTGVWSGTDQEPKIKAAFYRHFYEFGKGGTPVELPNGNFFVNRGLFLGYGDRLGGARLRGVFGSYGNITPGSTLVWNFTDEPLLSIGGARGTIVEHIGFTGPGQKHIDDNLLGAIDYNGSAGDDTLIDTWYPPAWRGAQASSRYAPAAMIAIDPRVGPPSPSSPTSRYRDIAFPSELTPMPASSYNLNAYSSNVLIQNFQVNGGGAVAVVIHPNENSDNNGDFVRLKHANIRGVAIGLSVCQTQARLTLLDHVDFSRVHTCVTNNTHGKQAGMFFEARNCHLGAIQIFSFGDMAFAGTITFAGCQGEEIWRIGDFGSAAGASTKMLIQQCKFSFSQDRTLRGVPATIIGGANGAAPLEINGGYWGGYSSVVVIDKDVRAVSIDGLQLEPVPVATTPQEQCFSNGTMGGLVFPQLAVGLPCDNIRPKFIPFDLSTGALGSVQRVARVYRSSRKLCTPLWVRRHGESNRADEGVEIPERVEAAVCGSTFTVGGTPMSGLTLTTTWPGRAGYVVHGPLPGDVLFHPTTKSTFVCMTANTTTNVVTWQLLNNYKNSNVVRNPINFAVDTLFYLGVCRYYSPNYSVYGIITAGSRVITDCGFYYEGRDGNSYQNSSQMLLDVKIGDYLVIDRNLEPMIGTSTNTQITHMDTALDGTTPLLYTITLAGAAVATGGSGGKRVRLGTFARPGVTAFA